MDKIELLGNACFSHGPYTFYKAARIKGGRVLKLGNFFLTKIWNDTDLVSIGELHLLWIDSRAPTTPLASLRLYFLPENTPEGRTDVHGEDEVLTITEKVVVRVHDLVSWISPNLEWSSGSEIFYEISSLNTFDGITLPQILTDPALDFSDVDRHQKEIEASSTRRSSDVANSTFQQTKVIVLSYPRYCRYRAVNRRLECLKREGKLNVSNSTVAIGGIQAPLGTRVLFCRDIFDYPDLETHEMLCNHLAPKLKGRPRRKRKKRSVSPAGESSNESEASVASSAAASTSKGSSTSSGPSAVGRPPSRASPISSTVAKKAEKVEKTEKTVSDEEKRFIADIYEFMLLRNTPLSTKMPLLGNKKIDLFLFYSKVQESGGYNEVCRNKLWKPIFDEMGGYIGCTSAATITRKHYEKLLLPYEKHCKKDMEDSKDNENTANGGRRTKTSSSSDASEDSVEVKREVESPPLSTDASSIPPSTPPPLQSIIPNSPFLPSDKPKSEGGKTSSLRSVRVKSERLKSLNSMIAVSQQQQTVPGSPTSLLATSSSGTSSPTSTPPSSTTPALERQLNSPHFTQQVQPSSSPPTLPVSTGAAAAVVTLTPPPEKDVKEIKLDNKQTSLLPQGKENIPLYEVDKPRSPEVIDIEADTETGVRDKIIIPSYKKRKLEILREGGLEVTPVELDVRPSVIQPTVTTPSTPFSNHSSTPSHSVSHIMNSSSHKTEDKFPTAPNPVIPKLINVTVTPDIGHIIPRAASPPARQQAKQPTARNSPTSRVINVGNPDDSSLLHLYANANVSAPHSANAQLTQRFGAEPVTLANGMPVPPAKVTQGKSLFGNGEKVWYGNPKDLLPQFRHKTPSMTQNLHSSQPQNLHSNQPQNLHSSQPQNLHSSQPQNLISNQPKNPSVMQLPSSRPGLLGNFNEMSTHSSGDVLDLSQKAIETAKNHLLNMPSLEIVKVPIVPRPKPLNLEVTSHKEQSSSIKQSPGLPQPANIRPTTDSRSKSQFATGRVTPNSPSIYANVMEGRTVAVNNLEITLVSPKKSSGGSTGGPGISQSPSPVRNNNAAINSIPNTPRQQLPPTMHVSPHTSQHHPNGKYPTRIPASESISPYSSHKPSSINNSGQQLPHAQQHPVVIPNVPNLSHLSSSGYGKVAPHSSNYSPHPEKRKIDNKEQRNRMSEGSKIPRNDHVTSTNKQQIRENDVRRHNVPTTMPLSFGPPGHLPAPTAASPFLAHQLAAANNIPSAAAVAAAGKYMPMLDPMYYSAFYSSLFPGPMLPPAANAPPHAYLPPDLNVYYKDLLAANQQRPGAQPHTAPTSK